MKSHILKGAIKLGNPLGCHKEKIANQQPIEESDPQMGEGSWGTKRENRQGRFIRVSCLDL